MYTKKQLMEEFGISAQNTLRETMKACGLPTSKQNYTEEERQKFGIARKMIDQDGKSYADVAEHFKVNARSADANGSAKGDNFTANQATEATGSMNEVALRLADQMMTPVAGAVIALSPKMLMYRVNEQIATGALDTAFDDMFNTLDMTYQLGNAQTLLQEFVQKEREVKQLMPASSQQPQLLPPSENLTEPSKNKSSEPGSH
jgi:uncharacterized membrane-anchored protein YhcB (DUF1043 family)